jgi:hypothetical protein
LAAEGRTIRERQHCFAHSVTRCSAKTLSDAERGYRIDKTGDTLANVSRLARTNPAIGLEGNSMFSDPTLSMKFGVKSHRYETPTEFPKSLFLN